MHRLVVRVSEREEEERGGERVSRSRESKWEAAREKERQMPHTNTCAHACWQEDYT